MVAQAINNQALQALLDKQEIHEVLMRYCRGVDRCDAELIRSAYHPGAIDNHGYFQGPVEEFIPWILNAHQDFLSTSHAVCNEMVELDGDKGYGEAYVIVFLRFERDNEKWDLSFGGRYIDRFERRDGSWRIAERTVLREWTRVDAVAQTFDNFVGRTQAMQRGEDCVVQGLRSREDLVYRR